MRSLAVLALLPVPVLAEAPVVVTDIAPIHSLAARVMQGIGNPVLLVEAGSDPHSFQMRPSQARALAEAKAVFWVGPSLTPWLDAAIDGLANPAIALELAAIPGLTARPPMFGGEVAEAKAAHYDEDGRDDADAHDEDHAGEAEATHGSHSHGNEDPHVWLDPLNATVMVVAMAERLAAADPANAAGYQANADAATAELAALDAELAARLAPVQGKPFVVFHDAYVHFADRYGLTIVGALAEGDAADPGAAHVAELRDLIAAGDAACVFAEALHDDRLLLAATEGAEVGHGKLDPEGSDLSPGADVYPAMMRALASTVADCLSSH